MSAPAFRPDPDIFPFESRWFDAGVGRIHYIDAGSGRPILLLHGNPTWSFLYRGIALRLQETFRCVAVDYPGFGLSDRPPGYGYTPAEHAAAVGELVDDLGLDEMIVMGQDWGGPIGLSVAAARADRVGGLVFGNTWFWPVDRLAPRVFSRVMSSPPARRAILERNLFVERLLPLGTANGLTDRVMDHYRRAQPDPASRIGVAEFPRQIVAAGPWLRELTARVVARLVTTPLLLTWGMKDPVFPPGQVLPRWTGTFQDVEIVPLPGARHFIQEDAPEPIAEAIQSKFG